MYTLFCRAHHRPFTKGNFFFEILKHTKNQRGSIKPPLYQDEGVTLLVPLKVNVAQSCLELSLILKM